MQRKIKTTQNTIHIGQSTNDLLSEFLSIHFSDSKKIILTDDNVFEFWIEQLVTSVPELNEAEIIQLPVGEDSKSIEIATQVWETLSENNVERKDLIINFGGGVITDLGGFVASIYKRGIDFVNIPTSLLAQVDASVGGKTGIDLGPFKNQIGTFCDAKKVLVNPNYLSTLPKEELNSGYAEMLKHGLISSKQHWEELKTIDFNKIDRLTSLVYDSIQIKNTIVSTDMLEKNVRKGLNFGHTIGHAIEGYFLQNDQSIKHGYAVAAGMLAEAYISFNRKLLSKKEWDEIHYIITDFYDKIVLDSAVFPLLLRLMKNDKKNESGQINFTLLTGIGSHIINQKVAKKEILDALSYSFS